MSELKLCPFCGGEAVPVYSDKGSLYTSNILMLSERGTVKCKKCEVRLPRIYSRVSKAIEVWNKRAEPSRPPEPQIVRCKDCKYWNPHNSECEGIGNWFGFEGEWSENGFCYKSERRQDAETET